MIICYLQPGIEYNIFGADVFSVLLCDMIFIILIQVNLLKRSSLCLFLVALFHIICMKSNKLWTICVKNIYGEKVWNVIFVIIAGIQTLIKILSFQMFVWFKCLYLWKKVYICFINIEGSEGFVYNNECRHL